MANLTSELQILSIKEKVLNLSQKTKHIHVSLNNKRNHIKEAPSTIVGIYDRFLCVESKVNHYTEKFTINYIDLITNNIVIAELGKIE